MVINGQTLSPAEAMTVRVALGSFLMDLNENGLGDDDHGRYMKHGYSECAKSVLRKMVREP